MVVANHLFGPSNVKCLAVYRTISKAVDRWDPQPDPFFKVLPLGLCLKVGRRVSENEANTLDLVEKHTSIPAPRLINLTIAK